MGKIKTIFGNVTKRQWLLLTYLPIHFCWYFIAEKINVTGYTPIHSALDDLIPFCEWFLIPYLLWFLYMIIPCIIFLIKDDEAFENTVLSLWIGFIVSMIIITVFPTGQDLRPEVFPRDNFGTQIMSLVYAFDTNTNVFPSMHVVGAIAAAAGIMKSKLLKGKKLLKVANVIWCILIVMATVMLKQHSILDVFAGLAIEAVVLVVVYKGWASKLIDKITGTKRAWISNT